MTIRNRLTLWYGGILLVSLVLLAGVLHHEWVEQLDRTIKEKKEAEPAWEEVGEIILFFGLPTSLVLLLGGWLLLSKSLTPIIALTQAVERIQLDNLKERLVRTGNNDELDRLTEVFNAMIARLEDSLMRVREFTLHASHELKTPLTVMRAELETALREDRSAEEQRELFSNQLEEIRRLSRIVDGLAFLTKADAEQASLRCEPLLFDELVKDSLADAQMLARPQRIEVELTACDEVPLHGDRHRLRQLLLNLSDNAIKYNLPNGRVTIALKKQGDKAELRIANTGPGIPNGKLPRVFDRFFRGDSSHNNEVEGCGLGLSIAQWIVKAHGGDIRIVSEPGILTTAIVVLPLSVALPKI